MHITLIGMSNIGKTYWSRRLAAEAGFERVDCDELIEQKLAPELVKDGYTGIHEVAEWMGQPFDPRHAEAARKYVECEKAVLREAIEKVRAAPNGNLMVIDTTGSFLYAGDDICGELGTLTQLIYLEASPQHASQLFERYIAAPKPVIWGDIFNRQPDEMPQAALARCYPKLLESRAARYKEIAHITIPFDQHSRLDRDTSFLTKPDLTTK